ncbi:MAG: hypothetical protein IT314_05590 [Anaerolineales bacterium]|nr:hypothetical protein [Anaerolineales bacterium]
MKFSFLKRPLVVSIQFLLLIVTSIRHLSVAALIMIGIGALAVSLASATVSIFKRHKVSHSQGKITRGDFVRNVSVEILGILLAMALAGLLGRYLAQIAMEQIHEVSIKFIVGIMIGLLAGMGVGVLVKRTWIQLVKISPGG